MSKRRWCVILVVGVLMGALNLRLQAQSCCDEPPNDPAVEGSWSQEWGDTAGMGIQMILLRNGKILLASPQNRVQIWDPPGIGAALSDGGTYVDVPSPIVPASSPPLPIELYCSGHSEIADGRIVFAGGGLFPGGQQQHAHVVIFDPDAPISNPWTVMKDMPKVGLVDGLRWYPTVSPLGDGTILITGGDLKTQATHTADIPLVFNPWTNSYTQHTAAEQHLPFYPFVFQTSNGSVFFAGYEEGADSADYTGLTSKKFNFTGNWDDGPVLPSFGPAVMIREDVLVKFGGLTPGGAVTSAVYKTDPTVEPTAWTTMAPMCEPRQTGHFLLLPDGTVLGVGGENASGPVLGVELYDPDANTWCRMDSIASMRPAHGNIALLPDGRVAAVGETTEVAGATHYAQIFSPPYLFQGPRPTIVTAPIPANPANGNAVFYQTQFDIKVSGDASDIDAISLMRPTSATHTNDFDQRYVPLSYATVPGQSDVLRATAPTNPNVAPPGYYMLFVLDNGVPSVAKWVRLVQCFNNVTCNDQNVCTFDKQCLGSCSSNQATFGDIAGTNGTCGPDGQVNIFDIFAVLDGIRGIFAYGCEAHNADISSSTACTSDGSVTIYDIFAVLDASIGA